MEKMTYEEAVAELETILQDLKSDKVSIDQLASRVDRAAKLAAFCSEKLRATEKQVGDIIEKLGL